MSLIPSQRVKPSALCHMKISSFSRPYLNIATLRTLRRFAIEATKLTSSTSSKMAR